MDKILRLHQFIYLLHFICWSIYFISCNQCWNYFLDVNYFLHLIVLRIFCDFWSLRRASDGRWLQFALIHETSCSLVPIAFSWLFCICYCLLSYADAFAACSWYTGMHSILMRFLAVIDEELAALLDSILDVCVQMHLVCTWYIWCTVVWDV